MQHWPAAVLQPFNVSVHGSIRSAGRENRAHALAEISRRWIRVDQEVLLKCIHSLGSPADFEATLLLTLPQLAPEHYLQVMDSLMNHLDPGLEAAPHTSMDIIQRLTSLPQHQTIGSGQSGNQDLLWQAVNRTAQQRKISDPAATSQWTATAGINPR